ncbi:MAG: CAAX prenyl protease-related protein [Bryobacteraceae bacterium]|nr:CAAX prenyl protease-related protein [Bryobacteraceae bacterium]
MNAVNHQALAEQWPSIKWIAPFAVFMALLGLMPVLELPHVWALAIRLVVPGVVFLAISRDTIEWRLTAPVTSVAVGVTVFIAWIAPDFLFDGWRSHWLFQNSITGKLESSLAPAALSDPLSIFLRVARAVVVVPVVEELFWRGWLQRWLIRHDFQHVPLGSYTRHSFWMTALLFASVHGPYWDVGLIAGAVYNGWMVRARSLADLVVAHAVTNACLAAFVLRTNRWEYWL